MFGGSGLPSLRSLKNKVVIGRVSHCFDKWAETFKLIGLIEHKRELRRRGYWYVLIVCGRECLRLRFRRSHSG